MDLSSLLACLLFVLKLPGIFAGLREGGQSDTCWAHCELRKKKQTAHKFSELKIDGCESV